MHKSLIAARTGRGRPAHSLLLLAVAAGLSACGGGNDDPAPAPPAPAPVGVLEAKSSCTAFPDATTAAATGNLAGAVTVPAGRTLTGFAVTTQPAKGTISLAANGSFTYTPTGTGRGAADTFGYRVTDSSGAQATGSATVIYGKRRIMPLGDSITEGVESYTDSTGDGPDLAVRIGYRKKLHDDLVAAGYAVDFVGSKSLGAAAGLAEPQNEGHSGWTSDGINGNVAAWLTLSRPDVVLLHIGTNDYNGGANVLGAQTGANVNTLVGTINAWANGTNGQPLDLALAQIIDARTGVRPGYAAGANAGIRAIYNANWADGVGSHPNLRTRLVDQFSALSPAADFTGIAQDDTGLHPNAGGYQKMAARWFQALVQNGFVAKCP